MHRRIKNTPAKDFRLMPSDEEHLSILPRKLRQLLELADEGNRYEDISVLTTTSLGTVKSRINRARTKILHMRAAAKTAAIIHAEETHV
jgi:DNA-binding NarL/FixJ family response regulator